MKGIPALYIMPDVKKQMEDTIMAESKYGKYVISDLKLASKLSPPRQGPNPHYIPKIGEGGRIQLLYLDNEIIKNALYSEYVWIMQGETCRKR
jgi:hypothetical protein